MTDESPLRPGLGCASLRIATIASILFGSMLFAGTVASQKALADTARPRNHLASISPKGCTSSAVSRHCARTVRHVDQARSSESCISTDGSSVTYFLFRATAPANLAHRGDVVEVSAPPCGDAGRAAGMVKISKTIVATRAYSVSHGRATPVTVIFGDDAVGSLNASKGYGARIPDVSANRYLRDGLYPYGLN